MDQKNYLWPRFFARIFDALLYIIIFFMVFFNIIFHTIYITVFLQFLPHNFPFAMGFFITFFIVIFYLYVFLIDCCIYSLFGNNIGKSIVGLKIVNADTGNKLTLAQYSIRTLRQMFSGFGLGIPILSLITFFIQYNIVFKKGRASYDSKSKLHSPTESDILNKFIQKPTPVFNTVVLAILDFLVLSWFFILYLYITYMSNL